ncbi:hypothetical protein LWM68_35985 [Niabella sp. W65]|nr:hypothetical protein [Niabella sp. W65]MCH7367682.1 hypothetical protein [Niabella sp. W65]
MMKKILYLLTALLSLQAQAQEVPYSQQMALTAMHMWPDSFSVTPDVPQGGATTRV